jgi:hypothetical protein
MIVLYSALLLFLGGLRWLVQRRARILERAYTKVALSVEQLAHQPLRRQGNSSRSDPYQSARQQYELGQLVQRRDILETRHFAWQHRADRLARTMQNLQSCKGRAVPYALGAIDISAFLYAVHQLGLGTVDLSQLVELLQTHLSM